MDNNLNDELVYGRNPVSELLKSGRQIEKIYVANGFREGSILKIIAIARERGIPVVSAEQAKLNLMTQTSAHQGVAAVAAKKEYCTLDDILDVSEKKGTKPFILIAEGITDVHNLGALIRTAESAGMDGVVIPKRNSAFVNETVYKTSAGACEYMPVAKVSNIASAVDYLKNKGVWIYGTDASGKDDIYSADLSGASAIIVGSEGEGMSRLVKEKCDFLLRIPMEGHINSLNASVAGAVVIYETLRQRKGKGE